MSWEHIASRDVKASRKRRACYWCGEMIEVGQPYHVDTGKWEGEFVACPVHPECHSAIDRSVLEDGYRAFEQIRGMDTGQQEAYFDGRLAWDKDAPRVAPVELPPTLATAWLAGWDSEQVQSATAYGSGGEELLCGDVVMQLSAEKGGA